MFILPSSEVDSVKYDDFDFFDDVMLLFYVL